MLELSEIFATPIYRADIKDEEIPKLAARLSYEYQSEAENPVLVSGEWDKQTRSSDPDDQKKYGVTSFADNNQLFRDKRWHPVADEILDCCRALIGLHNKDIAHRAYLETMWATIYPNGCYIPEHIHSNSMYSGVMYAQAEEGAGDLEFRDPSWALKSMHFNTDVGQLHRTRWQESVKTGRILLFPGWLPHASMPSNSSEDRIIIGFNLGFS